METSSIHVRKKCKAEFTEGTHTPTPRVFLHVWGSCGSADGEFRKPHGVAVSQDDTIVVADTVNHRIQCFRPNGDFVRKWGGKGKCDGKFRYPIGITVGTCTGIAASILHAMSQVSPVASFPPGIAPLCVAYVGIECLYVVDQYNNRIHVFEMDGHFHRKWGHRGSGNGNFKSPSGCCVDINHEVYVADTENYRIQVFDGNGRFLRKWGSCDQLLDPWSVAAIRSGFCYENSMMRSAHRGLIYVANEYDDDIICYHTDGILEGSGPFREVVNTI